MADNRDRWWTCVGYPGDSLPDDWMDILNNELHLTFAASPVHDADLNGDETEKKVHQHFVFYFAGKKSYDQVKEITDRLHAPRPQKVMNPTGMIRYLIHLDNPEKAQYRQEDIILCGGMNIESAFQKSNATWRGIIFDIMDFCEDYDIDEFSDLALRLRKEGYFDWFDLLSNRNTMFFTAYLKSKHQKRLELARYG